MIDILMATFNGEIYIKEQIDSLLKQTYTQWRLFIRDDGSSDGTWQILQKYARAYPQKIYARKNKTPAGSAKSNFFQLIRDEAARKDGKYIMFCDQDDVWLPDKIQCTLEKMKALEQESREDRPLLIATDLVVADESLNEVHPSFLRYSNLRPEMKTEHVMVQNNVTGCTVMINRTLLEMMSRVQNTDVVVMHDHFMALTALTFGKAGRIDRGTIYYRQHGNNSVGASNAKGIRYNFERLKRGRKKFRRDMKDSMRQSAYLIKLFKQEYEPEDAAAYEVLKKYSVLYKKCKLQRCFFYLRYKVLKKGINRVVMQFVWG